MKPNISIREYMIHDDTWFYMIEWNNEDNVWQSHHVLSCIESGSAGTASCLFASVSQQQEQNKHFISLHIITIIIYYRVRVIIGEKDIDLTII